MQSQTRAALATFIHADEPSTEPIPTFRPSSRLTISQALQKHSLVMPAVLRISIAVMAATLIAAALGNPRPYWVPLTVACVLQGVTVLATVHRTAQRAIGTLLGLLLGALILSAHPGPYWAMAIIMALQLIVELLIVRNYGVAVVFITPIPLLLVELALHQPVQYVVTARGVDTLLGCLIGAIAGLVLWHRASSVRLQGALAEALLAQGELLATVLAVQTETNWRASPLLRRVQTATVNLRIVYDGADPIARQVLYLFGDCCHSAGFGQPAVEIQLESGLHCS